jgi:hypothetical protein
MPTILLLYGRSDVPEVARAISDRLMAEFGSSSVSDECYPAAAGDSPKGKADDDPVAVIVVGSNWTESLYDPDDCLKKKIEVAVATDVALVPVEVHPAVLPSPNALPDPVRRLVLALGEWEAQTIKPGDSTSLDRLISRLREPPCWVGKDVSVTMRSGPLRRRSRVTARVRAVVPLPPRWPFPGTLSTLVVVELPDRRLMVVDSRRCACGKGGASPALAADRIQSNLAGKRVLVDGRAVGAPQGCAGIVAAVLLRTDFVPLVGRPTVRLTVDLEIEGIKEAVFVPAESCTML